MERIQFLGERPLKSSREGGHVKGVLVTLSLVWLRDCS